MKSLIFEGRRNVACDYDSTENDLLHQRNAAGVQIQTSENNEDFKKIVRVVLKFHHRYSLVGLQKRGLFFNFLF